MDALSKGFTLIETVVTVSICALIGIILVDFFISNDYLMRSQEAYFDVLNSARTTMNEARTSVVQAAEIVASRSFSSISYSTGSTTLILRLPSITSGGDLVAGQSDYILLYASGTTAYKVTEGGVGSARQSATRRLGDAIESFTFTFSTSTGITASPFVEVDIETQKSFKKTNADTHIRERIYLRNK